MSMPPLSGDFSGIQIIMILGAVLMIAGFATMGQQMLVIGLIAWAAFAGLAFLRQF